MKNADIELKKQDVVVLLKVLLIEGKERTYADLGREVGLSASQVFSALDRCRRARLVDSNKERVERDAALELLVHGLRYVFPAEIGGLTSGVPLLNKTRLGSDGPAELESESFVWPSSAQKRKGRSIEPLYKSAPLAAVRDPELHRLLSLVDRLRLVDCPDRDGVQRELTVLMQDQPRVPPPKDAPRTAPTALDLGEQDEQVLRSWILDAAEKLFSRYGFTRVDRAKIADAAGVSLAVVAHYFKDESAIRAACLDRLARVTSEFLAPLLVMGPQVGEEQLKAMMRNFTHFIDEREAFHRLLMWCYLEELHPHEERSGEVYSILIERLGGMLQHVAGTSGELDRFWRGYTFSNIGFYYAQLRWVDLRRLTLGLPPEQMTGFYRQVLLDGIVPLLCAPTRPGSPDK